MPDRSEQATQQKSQKQPKSPGQAAAGTGKAPAPAKASRPAGAPEARLARGFRDIEAIELRRQEAMLATIRRVYESYGFEPLETPAFEYTDVLGKFLPDQERPNAGVFSLQDEDDQWMSLRYDLTAPLARFVAQNYDRLPKPYRRYATGSVYRNEKPGPGRFRQFTQFDADTVGADSVAADAEMCMLAADTLEALGLKGRFVIKVNSRKVLDGLREFIGLGGAEYDTRWLTVMRAIDKYDRLGIEGVQALLTLGRTDVSGDHTPGAGLDEKSASKVMQTLLANSEVWTPLESGNDRVDNLIEVIGGQPCFWNNFKLIDQLRPTIGSTPAGAAAIDELNLLFKVLEAAGYGSRRVRFASETVRGLEYYTGPVFEAELTFEVKGEDGQPVRFGSVGGGGRYDDLVARFTGERVPATGFSIGVSRLQAALSLLSKADDEKRTLGPVVVLVMDRDQLPSYQRLTRTLRDAGIRAEMYLGSAGMKAQMKYADRRGSAVVVIQGSNEREKGEVQLKDLIEGEKAAAAIKDNAEWKAARPAQVTVAESAMVDEVKRILARYA